MGLNFCFLFKSGESFKIFLLMPLSIQQKNQHLLWRSGFGISANDAGKLSELSSTDLWKKIKTTSSEVPKKIIVQTESGNDENKELNNNMPQMRRGGLTAQQRKQLRKQFRENINELNKVWLDEMINSKAQLREKMSLFWHGHFACRVVNSKFQQELLHVVRTNALGNFGDLLKAVSKTPAMLLFLNNQQNKKAHPNENFAREVMELFTMGRGNYTETDVKEAARAFTGWSFDLTGNFKVRERQHDNDQKTFLGRSGNFDGDDVLNIILEQPATATFITRKIYKFLVNDQVDEERVEMLANVFQKSNYEILPLLDAIFTGKWFYDEENVGSKIKSPVELLVGIRRIMPLKLENDQVQILFQKVLGQVLFYPPNVAGWPGGRYWIDSSTLMLRMQMPQIFAAKESINIQPKSDDDVNMGLGMEDRLRLKRNMPYLRKGGSAVIFWDRVYPIFEKTSRERLSESISNLLIQSKSKPSAEVIKKYADSSSRESYIISNILNVMSTPEYQLC